MKTGPAWEPNVNRPKPVKEYFKPQGRFRHLDDAAVAKLEERINREYEKIAARAAADAEEETAVE